MREGKGNKLFSVTRTKEMGMGGTSSSAEDEAESARVGRVLHTDDETEKTSIGRSTTRHVATASDKAAVAVASRERWCGSV